MINKIILGMCLISANVAFAEEGCFNPIEKKYVSFGTVLVVKAGTIICSKIADGKYQWLLASNADMSGGCWAKDKYPYGSIVKMVSTLKQCVNNGRNPQWVDYKPDVA